MKNGFKIGIVAAGALTLACAALAQTVPSFTTLNASGSTAATVYFPSQSMQQARIVGAVATSDKSASVLSFTTGTTPASISFSNAAGTTITLARTNGLTVNDVLVIEGANGTTNATISAFGNSTNVTIGTATAWATLPGDQVFKMGAAVTIKCGATTASYQGMAIFAGNRGRPVRVVVDGTSACSLDAITARYE